MGMFALSPGLCVPCGWPDCGMLSVLTSTDSRLVEDNEEELLEVEEEDEVLLVEEVEEEDELLLVEEEVELESVVDDVAEAEPP